MFRKIIKKKKKSTERKKKSGSMPVSVIVVAVGVVIIIIVMFFLHQTCRWRTKQNLDYSYLMLYARSRGVYYVQVGVCAPPCAFYMACTTTLCSLFSLSSPCWCL